MPDNAGLLLLRRRIARGGFEFQNHETDLTNKFLFSDGGLSRRFISAPPKVATPSPSLFHQTLLPEDLPVSKFWILHWPL